MPPSIPIAFRLNPADPERPHDIQAAQILEAWRSQGWKDREIMVNALLALGQFEVQQPDDSVLTRRLQNAVSRLEALIVEIETGNPLSAQPKRKKTEKQDMGRIENILRGIKAKRTDEEE